MILGHNVEYTGSMSRLPNLVLECSIGGHLEGGPCQTGLKSGFLRGKKWIKLAEIFMGQSQPPAPCTGMQKPRVRVERLLRSVKQPKESDRVTL